MTLHVQACGKVHRGNPRERPAVNPDIISSLVHPYFTKDFGPLESAFVRSGDTFTLVCEADGFPRPKQENFSLSGPRTLFRQERLVPTTSGVYLEVSDASKENHSGVYHCIVNTEWTTGMIPGFRFTGHIASSTTLTVYGEQYGLAEW